MTHDEQLIDKPIEQTAPCGTHGTECDKVPHTEVGYLHAENDDSPYNVDDVSYCGRCHRVLSVNTAKATDPIWDSRNQDYE